MGSATDYFDVGISLACDGDDFSGFWDDWGAEGVGCVTFAESDWRRFYIAFGLYHGVGVPAYHSAAIYRSTDRWEVPIYSGGPCDWEADSYIAIEQAAAHDYDNCCNLAGLSVSFRWRAV